MQPNIVKINNHYCCVLLYKKHVYFNKFFSTPNYKLPLIKISNNLIKNIYNESSNLINNSNDAAEFC